jgi:hypothetical protein
VVTLGNCSCPGKDISPRENLQAYEDLFKAVAKEVPLCDQANSRAAREQFYIMKAMRGWF